MIDFARLKRYYTLEKSKNAQYHSKYATIDGGQTKGVNT